MRLQRGQGDTWWCTGWERRRQKRQPPCTEALLAAHDLRLPPECCRALTGRASSQPSPCTSHRVSKAHSLPERCGSSTGRASCVQQARQWFYPLPRPEVFSSGTSNITGPEQTSGTASNRD